MQKRETTPRSSYQMHFAYIRETGEKRRRVSKIGRWLGQSTERSWCYFDFDFHEICLKLEQDQYDRENIICGYYSTEVDTCGHPSIHMSKLLMVKYFPQHHLLTLRSHLASLFIKLEVFFINHRSIVHITRYSSHILRRGTTVRAKYGAG